MAIGIAIQLGLVLWPIGNYSTLVYQFLFLPGLMSIVVQPRGHMQSLSQAWILVAPFIGLLAWLSISALLAEKNGGELFQRAVKAELLICVYLGAISLLNCRHPQILRQALYAGCGLAALLAALTLGGIFVEGLGADRQTTFGLSDWQTDLNPVPAGIYFAGLALLSLALISPETGPSVKVLLGCASVFCLVVALLTGTRTAMVGFVAGLNYLLLSGGDYRRALYLNASIALVVLSFAAVDMAGVLELATRGGVGSWRPELWASSLKSSLEHPWFGMGYLQESSFIGTRIENGVVTTNEQPHSHNFYLQLLWWSGIVALGLYLWLLTASLRRAVVLRNVWYGRAAGTLLAYFCVVQFFDVYNVFTKPSYYWPLIFLPLGLLTQAGPRCDAPAADASENPRFFKDLRSRISG